MRVHGGCVKPRVPFAVAPGDIQGAPGEVVQGARAKPPPQRARALCCRTGAAYLAKDPGVAYLLPCALLDVCAACLRPPPVLAPRPFFPHPPAPSGPAHRPHPPPMLPRTARTAHGRSVPARGTGVFSCQPRQCDGHTFCESIHMGKTILMPIEVLELLAQLEPLGRAAPEPSGASSVAQAALFRSDVLQRRARAMYPSVALA